MAAVLKFSLPINNTCVYDLKGLRENFNLEDILILYKQKILHCWLKSMSYTKELDAVNSLSNPISIQAISNQGCVQAQAALQDNQNSIGLEHTAYADTADTVDTLEREINRAGSGTNKTGSETNRVGNITSKTGDDTNKTEPESPISDLKIALALLKVFKIRFDEDEIAAKVAALEIKQLHQSFLLKPQDYNFNEIKTAQIRYEYYLTLICKIKEHQNSLVYTDMLLDELCRSCYDLLTLDYMGFFCKLIDDAPIALFLALMHDKLRSFYLTDDKLFTSGMAENIAAAHVPSSIQVPLNISAPFSHVPSSIIATDSHVPSSIQVPSNITAPDPVPSILSEVTVNRVVERAEGRGSILERGKAYVGIEDYQIRQKLCAALQTHQVLLSQYMHTLSGRTSSATYGNAYNFIYGGTHGSTCGSAYGGTYGRWRRALPQGIKCLIVQPALHKGSMVCPAGHPELAKTQAELEYRFCVFDGLDYFFADATDTLSFLWVDPHKHVEPSYEQSLITNNFMIPRGADKRGDLSVLQEQSVLQKKESNQLQDVSDQLQNVSALLQEVPNQSSQNTIQQPTHMQAELNTPLVVTASHNLKNENETQHLLTSQFQPSTEQGSQYHGQQQSQVDNLQAQVNHISSIGEQSFVKQASVEQSLQTLVSQVQVTALLEQQVKVTDNIVHQMEDETKVQQNVVPQLALKTRGQQGVVQQPKLDLTQVTTDNMQKIDNMQQIDNMHKIENMQKIDKYYMLVEALKTQDSREQISASLNMLCKSLYCELCLNVTEFFATFAETKPIVIMLSLLYTKMRVFYLQEKTTKSVVLYLKRICPQLVLPCIDFDYQSYIQRHRAALQPFVVTKDMSELRLYYGHQSRQEDRLEVSHTQDEDRHELMLESGVTEQQNTSSKAELSKTSEENQVKLSKTNQDKLSKENQNDTPKVQQTGLSSIQQTQDSDFVLLVNKGIKCIIWDGADNDVVKSVGGNSQFSLRLAKQQGLVFDGLEMLLPVHSSTLSYIYIPAKSDLSNQHDVKPKL